MNLNDMNLIKYNGSEIMLIKWNGLILYTKDRDIYYVEYTVDNTSVLSLNATSEAGNYSGLPYIYSDESTYSTEYDKVEITLLDGTITDDFSTKCSQISKVKLWYPENTMAIKFEFHGHGTQLIKEISHIGIDNITDMKNMFMYNNLLTTINTSDWNTSNVEDMSYMFTSCESITSLDVSNWDISNVTDMCMMFNGCNNLTALDISNWNTSKVTDMRCVFQSCSSLVLLNPSKWNTDEVTNMSFMFSNCRSLTSLNLKNWNVSNVTDMQKIFTGCSSLVSLDLSGWNTSKVTNMYEMFSGCKSLKTLKLSNFFDTSNVSYMPNLFTGCSKLKSLDLSNWNTSKVTNMTQMFADCTSLEKLDLSNFDLNKVSISLRRKNMFANCNSLIELRLDNCDNTTISRIITSEGFPGPIEGVTREIYCKQENIGDLVAPDGWVFKEPIPLYKPYDFRGDTTITEVRTMVTGGDLEHMFDGCTSLTTVNTTDWDAILYDMRYMFRNCTSLKELDLSSIYTSTSVGMFDYMFYGCTALETLDIRNFDIDYWEAEEDYMAQHTFEGCTSLHTVRMDNCSPYTIYELTRTMGGNYTGSKTRTIYCRSYSKGYLTHPDGSRISPPSGWVFEFID